MDDLNGFQRDLLYVIGGLVQRSGQSVGSELMEYYGSKINHGRLYPNLDTLVDKGLAEKGELDHRTNYYALTAAGSEVIRKRREWENQHLSEDARRSPDPQAH